MSDIDLSNLDLSTHSESKPEDARPQATQAEFLEVVGQMLDRANELAADKHPQLVSSAILYAAARFNSYIVARTAESKAHFDQDHDNAIQFFQQQYEAMLKENLADYSNHYEQYLNAQ